MIKVCAFVDRIGSGTTTPDEEYAYIKKEIEDALDQEILFKKNISPWQLKNEPCDCYVIDYGGISTGGSRDIFFFKDVLSIVQEKPNTLFVLWSAFSERFYQETIEEENPTFKAPNVVFLSDSDNYKDQIKLWFSKD